ncbi:MAG: SDR family NAD(P)-dependent oxidoreductase, partial [Actinomycetota bacterium]|nr:SDR family NAD(P)-dependent oxidoreductase [Actinomycetota bacterium]
MSMTMKAAGVVARGRDRLDATVGKVQGLGRRAVAVCSDVADATALDAAADEIQAQLDPIDLWLDNAFSGAIAFLDDVTVEEFQRLTAVTDFG